MRSIRILQIGFIPKKMKFKEKEATQLKDNQQKKWRRQHKYGHWKIKNK